MALKKNEFQGKLEMKISWKLSDLFRHAAAAAPATAAGGYSCDADLSNLWILMMPYCLQRNAGKKKTENEDFLRIVWSYKARCQLTMISRTLGYQWCHILFALQRNAGKKNKKSRFPKNRLILRNTLPVDADLSNPWIPMMPYSFRPAKKCRQKNKKSRFPKNCLILWSTLPVDADLSNPGIPTP